MLIWDNQQATNWFVGFIEGEATFYPKNKKRNSRVSIPNNDKDLIIACEKFLRTNGILFNTYTVKAGKKIGYKIIVSKVDVYLLYNKIKSQVECRFDELQQMMGASTTTRNLTVSLPWLIGIIEAEGSFIITKNHRGHLTPKIELDNTNEKIINKIVKNLHTLDLSWYAKNYYPENKKAFVKITIQGVKRCKRFLQTTDSLWLSSRNLQRSKLMLTYCNKRLALPVNSGYTKDDYDFYNQMKQLNS